MKMLKWWEGSHLPKAKETPVLKKPVLLEELETPGECAAEALQASEGEKSLGRATAWRRPELTHRPGIPLHHGQ